MASDLTADIRQLTALARELTDRFREPIADPVALTAKLRTYNKLAERVERALRARSTPS